MAIKIEEYSKDISVSIKFDTEYVSYGNQEITYHTPKLGRSKSEQREYIFNKLQLHKEEIAEAIKILKKEWK